jgi:DHA2 family multidrug resistance protein
MSNFDTQMPYGTMALARVFQASGMAFLFVPINTAAYSSLPRGKSNNASALMNLARNLGGSIGVSLANTMLFRRSQFHQSRLVSNEQLYGTNYQNALHGSATQMFRHGLNSFVAAQRSMAVLYDAVQKQASMLSYLDVFKFMAITSFILIFVALLLQTVKQGPHEAPVGH